MSLVTDAAAQDSQQPQYDPRLLESIEEEQRLTDAAELSLEAALIPLLLQTTSPQLLTPAVLKAATYPVLVTMVLGIYSLLSQRSPKFVSSDVVTDATESAIDRSVVRLSSTIADARQKHAASETGDPYEDAAAQGFNDPDLWARHTANTAVTAVAEDAKQTLAEQLGLTHGRWLTRLDQQVRGSHRIMEGQTQPIGTKFRSGQGNLLERPGDTSAPISDWINCRCRLVYFRQDSS